MLADGSRGDTSTDAAMRAPMQKATVVKKPKTFCARTRLECIVAARSSSRAEWVDDEDWNMPGMPLLSLCPCLSLSRFLPRKLG